jgi:hypothetical protein
VFLDHLCDTSTYKQIDKDTVQIAVDATYLHINNLLLKFGDFLSQDDLIYPQRSIEVDDPFAYFYITAKVHKKNLENLPHCLCCQ